MANAAPITTYTKAARSVGRRAAPPNMTCTSGGRGGGGARTEQDSAIHRTTVRTRNTKETETRERGRDATAGRAGLQCCDEKNGV